MVATFQLLADAAQVLALALEGEGRGAASDVQTGHLGEQVQKLLAETVGEVFLVGSRLKFTSGSAAIEGAGALPVTAGLWRSTK